MYSEMMGDILRIKEGAIAHCITADASLGAGLAKKLDEKYYLKNELSNFMDFLKVGNAVLVMEKDLFIFNLITKSNRYETPSYEHFEKTIISMKEQMLKNGIDTVYVPQLGCGKDRLDWDIVKDILEKHFKNEEDLEICVLLYIPPRK